MALVFPIRSATDSMAWEVKSPESAQFAIFLSLRHREIRWIRGVQLKVGLTVGAVYDRTFFVESTKYARSQTAPTVHPISEFSHRAVRGIIKRENAQRR